MDTVANTVKSVGRPSNKPVKHILEKDLKRFPSIQGVANKYNVTEHTVRAWMREYQLKKKKNKSQTRAYKEREKLTYLYVTKKKTINEIAKEYNVTRQTISKWLKELNIEKRHHVTNKDEKEYERKRRNKWVYDLYHSYGLSVVRIATMFDVHRSTINRWLIQEQENQNNQKS
jgi:transposase-like protein